MLVVARKGVKIVKKENFIPTSIKYHDLSVLMKSKKQYINLTDSTITGDMIKLEIQGEDSIFLLTICNHLLKEWLVTEITISELMLLAGVTGKNFLKQLTTNIDEEFSLEMQAFFSAKKILNYNYGVIKLVKIDGDEILYQFLRNSFKNKKRVREAVLTKSFHRVKIW